MDKLELVHEARAVGFNPSWIAQVLEQYGPDILALSIEAVKNGLSVQLVLEILATFGPPLLHLLIDWLKKKKQGLIPAEADLKKVLQLLQN